MTEWCASRDMDLTWIEVMPMGGMETDRIGQYWSLEDVRATFNPISVNRFAERSGGPRYVRIEETGQKIGFITPLSHNFCESCNRVRLTCTGELLPWQAKKTWPICVPHCVNTRRYAFGNRNPPRD